MNHCRHKQMHLRHALGRGCGRGCAGQYCWQSESPCPQKRLQSPPHCSRRQSGRRSRARDSASTAHQQALRAGASGAATAGDRRAVRGMEMHWGLQLRPQVPSQKQSVTDSASRARRCHSTALQPHSRRSQRTRLHHPQCEHQRRLRRAGYWTKHAASRAAMLATTAQLLMAWATDGYWRSAAAPAAAPCARPASASAPAPALPHRERLRQGPLAPVTSGTRASMMMMMMMVMQTTLMLRLMPTTERFRMQRTAQMCQLQHNVRARAHLKS